MVAPSYQEQYTILSEPFFENGKYYVKAKHKNTGNTRKIRWYSDSEYAKTYGKKIKDNGFDNLKEARGFTNGPILVVRKNKVADEEWLRQSVARYAMGIGWYIASTDELPTDYPPHFKFLLLGYNEAIIDERHMKEPKDLAAVLDEKQKKGEWVAF